MFNIDTLYFWKKMFFLLVFLCPKFVAVVISATHDLQYWKEDLNLKGFMQTDPEHVLLKILLLRRIISKPFQYKLAEVSKENEPFSSDVVWNVNDFLFWRI